MINKDEVRLMTKLAIIDKNKSGYEKDADTYFKSDYIYMNNLKTRVCITLVYIIIVGAYYFNAIYIQNENPLTYDIPNIITRLLVIYGVVLFVFSIISGAIYSARYKRAEEKNKQYMELLNDLKQIRGEG